MYLVTTVVTVEIHSAWWVPRVIISFSTLLWAEIIRNGNKDSVSLEGWECDGLRLCYLTGFRRGPERWEGLIWLTHWIYSSFFFLMCYFEIIIGVQEVEEIIQSPMYPSASFPEWLHLIWPTTVIQTGNWFEYNCVKSENCCCHQNTELGTSWWSRGQGCVRPLQGAQVQPLAGKLKCRKLHGTAEK